MSSHVKPDIQRCPQYSTSSVCFIIHASGWTWPTFKAFHDTQHVLACVANTINTRGKLATWNHWLLHLSTILFQSLLRCSKENSCSEVSLNPWRVCHVRFPLIFIGANTYTISGVLAEPATRILPLEGMWQVCVIWFLEKKRVWVSQDLWVKVPVYGFPGSFALAATSSVMFVFVFFF